MLVWAACVHVSAARAQQLPAPEVESTVEGELGTLRAALEQARFDEARARARTLLARDDLRARERNAVLELLAVAQIAARDEASARATLRELYTRDPEHREELRDPGPSVSAAFARSRAEAQTPIETTLAVRVDLDAATRPTVHIEVDGARDAVESVHVFTLSTDEPSELVAQVRNRRQLSLVLPAVAHTEPSELALRVEAHAPSGSVLARAGTSEAPLRFKIAGATSSEAVRAPPLRRAWWLWTSVAIVVAGLGVSGAIAAQ